MLENILNQLGIDSSIGFQFALTTIFFILFSKVVLNKLFKVIVEREEKTTKLDGHADEMFGKINTLSEKYDSKIKEAQAEAQKIFNEKKSLISSELHKKVVAEEETFAQRYEEKKKELVASITELKAKVLADSTDIESEILNKLKGN